MPTVTKPKTVESVVRECDTGKVQGLSLQIIDFMNQIRPGILVSFTDLNVDVSGEQNNPYLQAEAKKGLAAAIAARGKKLKINSAYRTVAQQFIIFEQFKAGLCQIQAAAPPGRSNHESGLALDIQDPNGWKPFLEANGWKKLGSFDPPHFDYVGGGDSELSRIAIQAFQELWNHHNPGDLIATDGLFGSETAKRLRKSPANGFNTLDSVLKLASPQMKGAYVERLQDGLLQLGFELKESGKYDKATESVVKEFQSQEGLSVDGIVGPATFRAIQLRLKETAPVVVSVKFEPRVERIHLEALDEKKANGLRILTHLGRAELAEVKNILKLGHPDVVGPTTLLNFVKFCEDLNLDFSEKGVIEFKDNHQLGNDGALKGVIGAQTAATYFKVIVESQASSAANRKINAAGLELVKEFEGLHELKADGLVHAYIDPVGVATIGYGHTKGVSLGQVISKQRAEELLLEDLELFAAAVERHAPTGLSDNQFSALVSFTFNVGEGAFANSTLLRKLRKKDFAGAANEFLNWNKGEVGGRLVVLHGLTRRRRAEKALFES